MVPDKPDNMIFTNVFLLLCLLQDIQTIPVQNAECTNYKLLPRDKERSVNNTTVPSDQSLIPCDDSLDGWHRFQNGEIATTCVAPNHCGTASTMWMRDAVPDIGHTDENEFCVNHDTSTNPNPCCLFTMRINVTNCGGFLVYDLRGQDVLCPAGYCSDILKPCPLGQTSPTGFEPCNGVTYPVLTEPPVLGPPVITSNGHEFSQTCHISYNDSLADVGFEVMWMFNKAPYKFVTLTNGETSTALTAADWVGHVGEELSCQVEAFYISQGRHKRRHDLISNEYLGGIISPTLSLNVSEGEHETMIVYSTLPVVCPRHPLHQCRLTLPIDISGDNPDMLVFEDKCTFTLTGSDWDPVYHRVEARIRLSTKVDPFEKDDMSYRLVLKAQASQGLFDQLSPIVIDVTTHDMPHLHCMVLGSAEFVGLNTQQGYRLGNYSGDFLMYKANNTEGTELQVQIRTWRPIGETSSVCGVALQYGDSLVSVDMCGYFPEETAPVLTAGMSNTGEVRSFSCGSHYEIVTVSGVRLSVYVNLHHIDIKLHIPPGFTSGSQGACLYQRPWSYIYPQEISLYGVSTDDSLFAEGALPFTKPSSGVSDSSRHCQCSPSAQQCSLMELVRDRGGPFSYQYRTSTVRDDCVEVTPHAMNPGVMPRELLNTTGHLAPPIPIDESYKPIQACQNAIYQTSDKQCSITYRAIKGVFINICSKDILVTDEVKENVQSALQGFHWYCQEETLKDTSEDHLKEEDVKSLACRTMCGSTGRCVYGDCVCNAGYAGVDCTVHKASPPRILGIKGGSTCAMSSQHCLDPIILTRNVLPGDMLSVHFDVNQVLRSSSDQFLSFNMDPVYENPFSVSLPLVHTMSDISLIDKAAIRFNIKLTNDGGRYSDPISYIVYDDRCLICDLEDVDFCVQKEDSCHIDGKCYSPMETNPSNTNQICDPDKALIHWS